MSKIPHFQHNAERQVKESNLLAFYSLRFSKPLPTVRILGLTNPVTIPDSYFRLGFCDFADFSAVYRMTTLPLAPTQPDNVSWDSILLSALSSCTMGNIYSGCLDRSQG